MLRKYYLIIVVLLSLVLTAPGFFGFDNWEISTGYFFSNSRAAKSLIEETGGNPEAHKAITGDIHLFRDYGDSKGDVQLRLGVVFSTVYLWNFWRSEDSLIFYGNWIGQGYGAYRLGFMPEVYLDKRNAEYAMGMAVGMGFSIHYFDDNIGKNDNNNAFECFIRPQFSMGLGNNTRLKIIAGYHLPFMGTTSRYWYYSTDWERIDHIFSPSDLAGPFVNIGVAFHK